MREFIEGLARDAGAIAMDFYGRATISSKGEKNTLTEADLKIDTFLKTMILEKYPEHNIVTEETQSVDNGSEYTWYIDPIDGTNNFAHNDPHFCVSIAFYRGDEPEYACTYLPVFDELFFAKKGHGAFLNEEKIAVTKTRALGDAFIQMGISPLKARIDSSLKWFRHFMLAADRARDYGFCAGQMAYVACGRADAIVKEDQNPWDIAAGILLVKEAGGAATDETGTQAVPGKTAHIVASNKLIHTQILDEIKKLKR